MAQPEEIDLPEEVRMRAASAGAQPDQSDPPPADPDDPGAGADGRGPGGPPHPDEMTPLEDCSTYALNDLGNGQRFVRHFGDDLLFVSRIGWHFWDSQRWSKDEEISKDLAPRVRRLAHKIGPLIEEEIIYIKPSLREAALLDEERGLQKRETEMLGLDRELEDDERSELSGIMTRLKAIEGVLKSHKSKVGRHVIHAKNAGNNGPLTHL